MRAFRKHIGVAAPLLRINVDTDAIIPSREVKQVSKKGLSGGLFADWRYLYGDTIDDTINDMTRTGANPAFILNQPGYEATSILLTGNNFGCGSSREYAVWALLEYGIRAIIAPGFGSIFFNNCLRNGLLPVVLEQDIVETLARQVLSDPRANRVEVDLENCSVTAPDKSRYSFQIPTPGREMLLDGLEAIDVTLQQTSDIKRFKIQDRGKRPWAYLD